MTVTHVEKANLELRGLYNYLEKEFLTHVYPEAEFVTGKTIWDLKISGGRKRVCIRFAWRRSIRF